MEPISWEKIATSKPFYFLVGRTGRKYSIHSALVSSLSAALGKLINNKNFKEANNGHARLTEVDEGTFLCFIEYAYTKDYKHAATGDDAMPADKPTAQTSRNNWQYGRSGYDSYYGYSSQPKKTRLWEKLKHTICKAPHAKHGEDTSASSSGSSSVASGNHNAKHLLPDARIFIFADRYDIADLAQLALHNIGQTLLSLQLSDQNAGDIVALLRYCYETPAPDRLKSLVVLYAACNMETLLKEAGFKELMEEHSDLSTALVGSLVERLD